MKNEIIEGNKLLFKFYGWKRVYPGNAPVDNRGAAQFEHSSGQTWWCFIQDGVGKDAYPLFDKDWNLLMPIVCRIEGLGHCVHIVKNGVMIKQDNTISSKNIINCFGSDFMFSKQHAIWLACVQFAKWYKENKK